MADDEKQTKPRRKRTPKKGAEAEAPETTEGEQVEAGADDPADAPAADAGDAADIPAGEGTAAETGAGDAEESKPQRRGSAETSTPTQAQPKPEPRRDAAGAVIVSARARYVRSAPRKARLVMDHIRGKPVEAAVAMLTHTPRSASRDVLKLLNSAIANAENNYELGADELRVHRATVDEGPTIKRYQPRALGRATRIDKRTSHMTITLTTATEPASPAKRKRR